MNNDTLIDADPDTDKTRMLDARDGVIWDPRADMDDDGDVDDDDVLLWSGADNVWPESAPTVAQAFSDVGNPFMFQGVPHFALDTADDAETATLPLNHHRARFADPVTGRWGARDPLEYLNGANTYEIAVSNVINFLDPFGLLTFDHQTDGTQRCEPAPKVSTIPFPNANAPDCFEDCVAYYASAFGGFGDAYNNPEKLDALDAALVTCALHCNNCAGPSGRTSLADRLLICATFPKIADFFTPEEIALIKDAVKRGTNTHLPPEFRRRVAVFFRLMARKIAKESMSTRSADAVKLNLARSAWWRGVGNFMGRAMREFLDGFGRVLLLVPLPFQEPDRHGNLWAIDLPWKAVDAYQLTQTQIQWRYLFDGPWTT